MNKTTTNNENECIKMNETTTSYENKYRKQQLLPFLILVRVAGEYLFGHNFDK